MCQQVSPTVFQREGLKKHDKTGFDPASRSQHATVCCRCSAPIMLHEHLHT